MTKRFLIVLSGAAMAILVAWVCFRPTPVLSSPKSMNTTDQELELQKDFDLGLILDTTVPVQLAIPVKNVSSREITIRKIERDCSCFSVKVDKQKLAPGETMTLRYVANLSGRTGGFTSGILIESDAGERFDEIRIRGRITGQVRVRPRTATILVGDRNVPAAITIFCDDQDGPWKYTGFASNNPHLQVALNQTATSPTTSTYEGTLSVDKNWTPKSASNYSAEAVTFTFENDQLKRSLDVIVPVEIALRRDVTIDPPQVMFLGGGAEQKRTILLQSVDALAIDAARCPSPCIKASIHRIDGKSVSVHLVFEPSLAQGNAPRDLACELLSDGKTIGSVPINIVEIP